MKAILAFFMISHAVFGQCGKTAYNALTGKQDCVGNPATKVSSLPATCTVGDLASLTVGAIGVYRCSATDTWTAISPNAGHTETVTAQTTVTIAGTTHGQGANAIVMCWDDATPRRQVLCDPRRAVNGDLTLYFNPAFTGIIQVYGSTLPGTDYVSGRSVLTTPGALVKQGATNGVLALASAGVDYAAANASTTVNGQTCALGGTCTVTADPTSAKYTTRVCELHIWGSGASQVLQDADDEPASCYNGFGAAETITAVSCWANAGSPTVTPIITGGAADSILTGAITCGTGSFVAGTLNGTPTLANAGTIDANVTAAGGTATNIRIVVTLTR